MVSSSAEHEEIAKTKVSGELLNWDDLSKMKHTWKAAMETMRIIPPVFGGFRKVLKDFEYGGYLIPKGWQVSQSFHYFYQLIKHTSFHYFHYMSRIELVDQLIRFEVFFFFWLFIE